MRKKSKLENIFLYLSVISGALWAGAYLLRLFIFYWLFEPEDFVLKSYINESTVSAVVYTLLPALTTTFVLYIIFILSFIIFLLSTNLKLKDNGWLFISLLIIVITLPFEAYLMIIDYDIIQMVLSNRYDGFGIIHLVVDRFRIFGNFSLIELFSYFSIFYFILFKPFTKIKNEA